MTAPAYTKVDNVLLEYLAALPITGSDFRVLMFLLRKVWGYHKTIGRISLTQIQKGTGLRRNTVTDSLERLRKLRVIQKVNGERIMGYEILLPEDYNLLDSSPDRTSNLERTSPLQRTRIVRQTGPILVRQTGPLDRLPKEKKENIKETIFTEQEEKIFTTVLEAYRLSTGSKKKATDPTTKRNILRSLEFHDLEEILEAVQNIQLCEDNFLRYLPFETIFRQSNSAGSADYIEQILRKYKRSF